MFFGIQQNGDLLRKTKKMKLKNIIKFLRIRSGKNLEKKVIQRWDIHSEKLALDFLEQRLVEITYNKKDREALIISDEAIVSSAFSKKLKEKGIKNSVIDLYDFVNNVQNLKLDNFSCIVTTCFTSKNIHNIGNIINKYATYNNIPFEYISISDKDYVNFKKFDHFTSTSFISPLFIDKIDYFKIYEESLNSFDLKCEIRDYLDLAQLIKQIIDKGIQGSIAEFGSYRGHSGYLITKILEALGDNRQIYLFDTFEYFPEENLGIDMFWSKTHYVNFEEVSKKFISFENVKLVKGDFINTIKDFKTEQFSLIYVDCDSFRATSFILNELYELNLTRGGIIIFEDYGHPALLGNRLAFHDFFDKKNNCFSFFSSFSGFNFIVKL